MVETAAHLVDQVFPRVPVRQWVLSFPWPLRLLFAARPEVLTRVLNVVARTVSSAVLKRVGLSRSAGARAAIAHGSAGAAKHMAGIAPAILLHSRHPWRSDVRERPLPEPQISNSRMPRQLIHLRR